MPRGRRTCPGHSLLQTPGDTGTMLGGENRMRREDVPSGVSGLGSGEAVMNLSLCRGVRVWEGR